MSRALLDGWGIACPHCGTSLLLPGGRAARSIRRRAGLTLRQAAAKFGVDSTYLSKVETGREVISLRLARMYKGLAERARVTGPERPAAIGGMIEDSK